MLSLDAFKSEKLDYQTQCGSVLGGDKNTCNTKDVVNTNQYGENSDSKTTVYNDETKDYNITYKAFWN